MVKIPLLQSLAGTWIVERLSGDGSGILVITPEGRVVQFSTSAAVPKKSETMRLWASDDGKDILRLRSSPSAEGWTRRIIWSGSNWTHEGREHLILCRPATDGDLPPWFTEELEKNLLRMAGAEEHGLEWANRQTAARHLPAVYERLKREEGFEMVELSSHSDCGGCLLVQGAVESEAQLRKLNDTVSSTDPPVAVCYAVTVSPEIKAQEEEQKKESEEETEG